LRTYCGGSWAGITHHLGYIQDMGFDAVWISPVVKNVDGTAYGDGYHGRVPSHPVLRYSVC
jgi:alpha-amylase